MRRRSRGGVWPFQQSGRMTRQFGLPDLHMAKTTGPDLEKAALVDPTVDEMTQRGIEAVISVRQATLSLAPSGGDFTFDPYGIAHVDQC